MKPNTCSSNPSSEEPSYSSNNSSGSSRIRVIRLKRRNNVPLGFSVRGGREHGTGIFVSEVRAGSEAHHQGLLVGDQILRINGFNIEHAIHDEVLALLRAKPGVVIKVKIMREARETGVSSCAISSGDFEKGMGMIPVKDTKKDPLTWKIVDPGPSDGEPNGKVPIRVESHLVQYHHELLEEQIQLGSKRAERSPVGLILFLHLKSLDEQCVETTRISIPAIGASGLGCSIVKGPPDVPGIYVQSVKPGGLAEKAGLQVGDRIIEVNGHDFTNLDFPEAVAMLKSSKQMSLVLHKCAGLHLFPDETQKRSSVGKQEDNKKLSCVQEEEAQDERDAKMLNGHSDRVKSGSEHKHLHDGGIMVNGNSSCSSSDVSSQQVMSDVSWNKYGNSIEVHATVHSSSSGEGDQNNFISKCSRESGDGMDIETLSGHKSQPRKRCPWNNDELGIARDIASEKCENGKAYHTSQHANSCSEDDSCSSSLSSGKETFMSSDLNSGNGTLCMNNGSGDKTSITSDEKSELSSISSDDYLGIPKITSRLENLKPQNEFLKRKQHELLMEEFREVHKKMFGQGPPKVTKPPKQANKDGQDHSSPYRRRQQMRKDKTTPPPPPDITECGGNKENSAPKAGKQQSHEALYNDMDGSVAYRRRQREPPITDSREPEPKPPHTYFEKPDGTLKPLVTIGTYSNAQQQNRFLSNASTHSKDINSHSERADIPYVNHHKTLNSSSASSTVLSSSSSEPRSPTSESVASSDSIFSINSPPVIQRHAYTDDIAPETNSVLNSFQLSLSQFIKCDKKILENDGRENKVQISRCRNKAVQAVKYNSQNLKSQKLDSNNEILLNEAEGREVQTVILKKNGPLNFTVEGGINSDLAGKIMVSEILPGSCTTEGGSIESGDQILMVDNTRLTGLSLTAANVVLRNANSNSSKEMKLVIAKAQKTGKFD